VFRNVMEADRRRAAQDVGSVAEFGHQDASLAGYQLEKLGRVPSEDKLECAGPNGEAGSGDQGMQGARKRGEGGQQEEQQVQMRQGCEDSTTLLPDQQSSQQHQNGIEVRVKQPINPESGRGSHSDMAGINQQVPTPLRPSNSLGALRQHLQQCLEACISELRALSEYLLDQGGQSTLPCLQQTGAQLSNSKTPAFSSGSLADGAHPHSVLTHAPNSSSIVEISVHDSCDLKQLSNDLAGILVGGRYGEIGNSIKGMSGEQQHSEATLPLVKTQSSGTGVAAERQHSEVFKNGTVLDVQGRGSRQQQRHEQQQLDGGEPSPKVSRCDQVCATA
jgi:hypothetical protein